MRIVLNFTPFSTQVLQNLLAFVLKQPHIESYIKFNNAKEFIETVQLLTGLKIIHQKGRFKNNFPPLESEMFSTTFNVVKHSFTIKGGSVEPSSQRGKNLLELKSRGEFLERLSSLLPLNLYGDPMKMPEAGKQKFSLSNFCFPFLGDRKKINGLSIFYGLRRYYPNEELSIQPTSSGSAGHFDYDTAVLNAILELIQRDAFFVHWLNSLSPRHIEVEEHFSTHDTNDVTAFDLKKIIGDLKKYHLEYHFLDITTDVPVPAVCCVLVSNSPTGKRVFLGASAGFDPYATLLSAATEAISVAQAQYYKDPYILPEKYVPFSDASLNRERRLRLYMTDTMYEHIAFFFSNTQTISVIDWSTGSGTFPVSTIRNTKERLSFIRNVFRERAKKDKNETIYTYRIQNKVLRNFSYSVVRAFCEGLYPLYLNENYADPQHRRLAQFVEKKGYASIAKLNPWPHPFP